MKRDAQGNLAVGFARAKSEGGERGWGPARPGSARRAAGREELRW